ncbi:MAG: hypothetical protein QXQ46_04520, partial [Thermoplasmatales archaeon]
MPLEMNYPKGTPSYFFHIYGATGVTSVFAEIRQTARTGDQLVLSPSIRKSQFQLVLFPNICYFQGERN